MFINNVKKLKILEQNKDDYSVTIILPVINETKSLLKTVKLINKNNYKKKVSKILIVMSKKRTLQKSKNICVNLKKKNKKKFDYFFQSNNFLGGAMQDSFKKIKTSHCVIMSSDLETNPVTLKKMIKYSYENQLSIITASRWDKKKSFNDYGALKIFLNYLFQKFFSFLYNTKINDLTFGYRIFPTKLVKNISWEMKDHSFLFETIVKPLKMGAPIIQISSNWNKRTEGTTSNEMINYFKYIFIGLKVYFSSKKFLIKN